ncbi:glycyl-tRNA ligase subunit beta [Listeria fleischmannii 1991]|uniref:Glycine--tRNA ligase beta subunit n=2 Tax=Listeria fleischmannii TaxID=1069827 RepID=A0A2X3HH53_9LIST|nr:glycine--tRNA ligase subunit beta [Listeria fleischmannii]EMG27630.1 glycyl-tRNA ligase subunit beta [Listeria fleischmannii subsp. fleischmannii LU2006-1]KMT60480.1 glycyl-tRNA ligase subunit beta [Listeria fleischmannii 1991]SQC71957.1 Glycine--tRNA ligase beta subunit [Listeria fleischmannii subsp. fleischmannii]
MNKDFLLEIGLEEMPAKYITASAKQLKERATEWFKEKKIAVSDIETYSSPRRLTILAKDVAIKQEDQIEEAKGPAKKIAFDEKGDWSKAAQGFARSQGVAPEDLSFQEIKGTEYIYIKKEVKGLETSILLPEFKKIITDMTFPVSMHWSDCDLRYIRPIKWLIALFGTEVIPFEVAGVKTGNETRGHRFLGQNATIHSPADYEKALLEQFVVADADARKEAIREQIAEIETIQKWNIPADADLLEEVNNLVEYPTALFGDFEEAYLELPEEVLITTMKEHQRYFPVFDQENRLLPHFITVRNGNHEHLDMVQKGNEKVLRARLSDADFFYQEDLKMTIDEAVHKLKNIVFHEKLGSLTEKMKRVQKVALLIADYLSWDEEQKKDIYRVTDIYKFDLVTNIVGEFPELQGIMGEKYARLQGENEAVATAIREHYMPISAEGELPKSDLGSLLAISDKLETLISFFCINIIPTGSADPFSLRRSAFGVMRIIQANEWNLPLAEVLAEIVGIERKEGFSELPSEEVYQVAQNFMKNRLRVILRGHDVRQDIIEAVVGGDPNRIPQIIDSAKVLNESTNDDWFRPTIEALTRVTNIAKKYEDHEAVDPSLFENDYEKELFDSVQELKRDYPNMTIVERLKRFAKIRPIIDNYFENTLVMSENEALKANRLALLVELSTFIREFAQMDEIQVK